MAYANTVESEACRAVSILAPAYACRVMLEPMSRHTVIEVSYADHWFADSVRVVACDKRISDVALYSSASAHGIVRSRTCAAVEELRDALGVR
jgi:hypothetical protein